MWDVKMIVEGLTHKYGSCDPFEICRALHVLVWYEDLGSVRGIYQCKYKKRIIHLNRSLNSVQKRQVCAHELGHAILHKNINTIFLDACTYQVTNKLEIQANVFAAELLIQDEDLKEYKNFTLAQAAVALNVHENLIKYKLKALSK